MNVSVIGAGYVGLVTGVCLAIKGHTVICVDKNPEKVDYISRGKTPLFEKDLEIMLNKAISQKKFSITTSVEKAVNGTDITLVCVGTYSPDGKTELTQIKDVSEEIGKSIKSKPYHTVVVRSTVVPKTTRNTVMPIIEKYSGKKAGKDFGIAVNPEFLREGSAVEDFMEPDIIIIGEYDKKSGDSVESLYGSFGSCTMRIPLETAEMIKYSNNTFLGLLVSYSNEIANICEKLGIDAAEVLKSIHVRMSKEASVTPYLIPGCGFGGSCLPKDVAALAAFSAENGYEPDMIKSLIKTNERRPSHTVSLLEKELKRLDGRTITVLGLAFKPDTDDVRSSTSIDIVNILLGKGAKVKVYDPVATDNARKILKDAVIYSDTMEEALKDSEGCILATKWQEFRRIDGPMLARLMKNPVIVDGRRFLDKNAFSSAKYIGIGL